MKKIFHTILTEHLLGKALGLMQEKVDKDGSAVAHRLNEIQSDYRLMKDYMLRGFRDERREELYRHLLRKAYRLAQDMSLEKRIRTEMAWSAAGRQALHGEFSIEEVMRNLEGFVQDIALAELGTIPVAEIYKRHHEYLSALFCSVLLSWQWTDAEKDGYCRLLLSPTIDGRDAQLLLSAVMLACMNSFDACKWEALTRIYSEAGEISLRQRALVGWVLALPMDGEDAVFPSIRKEIARLCEHENTCRELLEMQMQMLYCSQADADNEEIQRNIMPSLLKNSRLHFTEEGLAENDRESLQDILNPGAEDREMEELEQSMHRMMQMQQAGSDIYFGGFSQMKRFSFFSRLSNWFCPFYPEHPELGELRRKMADSSFLQNILSNGPFCDSDKYSFSLAMATVLDRIPQNIREMMNNREALGGGNDNRESSAYIRRTYLHDLYRFFRLYQYKEGFLNPFMEDRICFFLHPCFHITKLKEKQIDLEKFLLKKNKLDLLSELLRQISEVEPPEEHLLMQAMVALRRGNDVEAQQCSLRVLESRPEHEQAMRTLAQASFRLREYAEAEKYYAILQKLHPDQPYLLLYLSISQISNGHIDEGVATLYRMDYDHPEDVNVKRALAWGLLVQKKPEQAEKIYMRLLGRGENVIENDLLNAGYCQWVLGRVDEAAGLFARFMKSKKAGKKFTEVELLCQFRDDQDILEKYQLMETEYNLMVDITVERI